MPQTSTSPGVSAGPELLARYVVGAQWSVLDSWPRVLEILTRAGLQAWAQPPERMQQAALELWRDLVLEGARFTDATATELRDSADRQTVERERDEQQRRADEEQRARRLAERTIERLERELAQERERAVARSEQPASNQPPVVNVVHRDEDWAVVREDAKRASGVFNTKRHAGQRAQEIAP